MRIGIVGFGQFGMLLVNLLPRKAEILVTDIADIREAAAGLNCIVASFEQVCGCDIVIFCVPVQGMEQVIKQSADFLKPGAWVVEVASIKMLPAMWMRKYLPANVYATATHPLFGPQSAKRGLRGQKLVICPIHGGREHLLSRYARKFGLEPLLSDPESHDLQMAHVQALTHLIGKAIVLTGRPQIELATEPYKHLIELSNLVEFDTKELFSAIEIMNPHARVIARKFQTNVSALLREARQIDSVSRPSDGGSRRKRRAR